MKKSSRNSAGNGQIRIIGGQWRGRKLSVPDSMGLRPTPDRVRETLFNWLTPWLPQSRCLDCYAGSGVLGIEALSRYASQVTLLEREPNVVRQLRQSLEVLKTCQAAVVQTDTLQWLSTSAETYSLVFIDPPFRQGLLSKTIALLEENGWLSDGAVIYTESEVEHGDPVVPVTWSLHREKTAGQVSYRLYHRQASDSEKDQNHAL